jgi:haloalkane dehalogenase
MDVYRTPDERFVGLPGYPFEPRYAEVDGMRMHFVDEGPREGEPVLLLHGEPTWSFLYRKVIAALLLSSDVRCVAPDYFGFGRSDKPTDRDWYTYDRHTETVTELVRQLDLTGVTVVVQDWGGPIGLRWAVENPDRVARLVILNTGIFSGRPPSETWLQFREFMRRVDLDIRPGQLVNLTCGNTLSEDVVAAYDAPHPVPESRVGARMFPELVPTSPEHPAAERMLEVRDALSAWERPALVLFSDSDPVFTPRAAERMAERIPGAGPPEFVEGAGHFLQEQKGEEIGERIARFVNETA